MIKKAILATAAIAGLCAAGTVLLRSEWIPGRGPESVVRKRAEGYWNARVAGDPKLMAPYSHPFQAAIQENTLLVTDAFEITKVQVDGDKATVGIKAKYHLKMSQMQAINREMESEDHWVRYKDQWYHALHPVGFGEVLAQGIGKWKQPTAPPKQPAPVDPAPPAASVAKP